MHQLLDQRNFQQDHPSRGVIDARQLWANNRFWMESENIKSKRYGGKSHHHWYVLLGLMKILEAGLKITGLYQQGCRNAQNIIFRELPIVIPELPPAFHGFTILQLSDLHLDGMPGLEHKLLELIGDRVFDVCALTGDYRTELHGPINNVIQSLKVLVNGIQTRQGVLGILGNHDDVHMVTPIESLGVRMLINENIIFEKAGESLQFIGTDDVHYYYTDLALHALENAKHHFTVALIHSPELYLAAEQCGVNLYLCGHTHAGQVCLPGGMPLITHLNRGKEFFRGQWQYNNMLGITNAGAGTSGIPVRFNSQGEVLAITLLCGQCN